MAGGVEMCGKWGRRDSGRSGRVSPARREGSEETRVGGGGGRVAWRLHQGRRAAVRAGVSVLEERKRRKGLRGGRREIGDACTMAGGTGRVGKDKGRGRLRLGVGAQGTLLGGRGLVGEEER
eukprot:143373-Rhodomonas_salina.1